MFQWQTEKSIAQWYTMFVMSALCGKHLPFSQNHTCDTAIDMLCAWLLLLFQFLILKCYCMIQKGINGCLTMLTCRPMLNSSEISPNKQKTQCLQNNSNTKQMCNCSNDKCTWPHWYNGLVIILWLVGIGFQSQ